MNSAHSLISFEDQQRALYLQHLTATRRSMLSAWSDMLAAAARDPETAKLARSEMEATGRAMNDMLELALGGSAPRG